MISAGFGFVDLIERIGIERRVYATGPRKGMLDPFQDEKSDDIDRLRELHADIFENFKNHVRRCRGDRLRAADEALFTGDIWTGRQAVEVGLIDGLAEMRGEMRKRYGDKVKFQRAEIRRGLLSRLRGGMGGGRAAMDPADLFGALDDWAQWKRLQRVRHVRDARTGRLRQGRLSVLGEPDIPGGIRMPTLTDGSATGSRLPCAASCRFCTCRAFPHRRSPCERTDRHRRRCDNRRRAVLKTGSIFPCRSASA